MAGPNEAVKLNSTLFLNTQHVNLYFFYCLGMQMSETEFIDRFGISHKRHMLSMSYLVSAFIILCVGYGFATIVLIAEICWSRKSQKKQ